MCAYAVINFDIPSKVKPYVHRIGRTSRAGQAGTALSLVAEEEKGQFEAIVQHRKEQGHEMEEYKFKLSAINAFRYRAEDVLKTGMVFSL